MAHPMRREGIAGHNAKLRKYTRHYGAANPSMNKAAAVDADFQEGDQPAQGFGVEGNAMPQRNDRAARRAMNANPVATYKKGGAVKARHKAKKRADGGDVSSIEAANRDQSYASGLNRARGGRARSKKGATHVNVIVAPQSGNSPQTPPPVLPVGGNPAMAGMPPAPPPMPPHPGLMGVGMPGAGPSLPMPPGAMPPGALPPRKRGGRIERHDDAKEDRAMIRSMVKPGALKRARGGLVKIGLDEGSLTGEGRLVKAAARAKRKAGDKSAEV